MFNLTLLSTRALEALDAHGGRAHAVKTTSDPPTLRHAPIDGAHVVHICAHARSSEIGRWLGASLSTTALGDRVHARRDVLDILRVDARHREAAVARAEDVVLRREGVHLLRVRLQL